MYLRVIIMPDETLMKLREQYRKRRRKFLIAIGLFFLIVGILAIVHLAFMYILAIGLMLVGVVSMMNMGAQITRMRYFTLPVENGGFHEHEQAFAKERESNFSLGLILSCIGFGLFLLSLYLTSIGWRGLF
ncbi:MAG: hypothetical protein GXO25_07695 [Euryarchaeota archaeon]|nr:hypothetical protein [Euryarchaeota archaeon]